MCHHFRVTVFQTANTIKKKKLCPSTEVSLKVNTEKTKNMLPAHQQNAGQNHNIKTANKQESLKMQ
jgi:hypothetical protein